LSSFPVWGGVIHKLRYASQRGLSLIRGLVIGHFRQQNGELRGGDALITVCKVENALIARLTQVVEAIERIIPVG